MARRLSDPDCGRCPSGGLPDTELRDGRMPPRVLDLSEPPDALYVRGELPRGPSVAIVGTRRPTPEARKFAKRLARDLAGAGVTVLSGGAKGIDAAAHEGALRAHGTTVVVAPSGFDKPFPEEHAELFRKIVDRGGAYVSLWPADVAARRHHFFARNELLVALSHAVIVVESPYRSGARNTAKHARLLGRTLFVVPGAPWNPRATGCLLELRLGARLLMSSRDVLRELELQRAHAVPLSPAEHTHAESGVEERATSEFLGPRCEKDEEALVLAAVRDGADHADAICARTGLPAGRVQAASLTLALKGSLVPDPAGRIRLVKL